MGLTVENISALRIDYPTLLPVREMIHNGQVNMFVLNILDSQNRTGDGFYRVLVHCPNPSRQVPNSYVINNMTISRHPHAYNRTKTPGTNSQSYLVCQGNYGSTYQANPGNVISKISGYINHIISVLNA